jgi:List-Bact-rpt repeat protein
VPAIGPGEFRVEWIFEALSNLVQQFPGSTSTKYAVYYDGQAGWTGVCGMANGSDVPGIECAASCTTSWNDRSALTLSARAEPGQRFVRWGGACTGSAECQLSLSGGASVTALFAPLTYRLDVRVVGRGTVRTDPRGVRSPVAGSWWATFTSYEPVKLVARAATGWRLKGWAGSARGTRAAVSVPMSGAAGVRAVFVKVKPEALAAEPLLERRLPRGALPGGELTA